MEEACERAQAAASGARWLEVMDDPQVLANGRSRYRLRGGGTLRPRRVVSIRSSWARPAPALPHHPPLGTENPGHTARSWLHHEAVDDMLREGDTRRRTSAEPTFTGGCDQGAAALPPPPPQGALYPRGRAVRAAEVGRWAGNGSGRRGADQAGDRRSAGAGANTERPEAAAKGLPVPAQADGAHGGQLLSCVDAFRWT